MPHKNYSAPCFNHNLKELLESLHLPLFEWCVWWTKSLNLGLEYCLGFFLHMLKNVVQAVYLFTLEISKKE